jgi:4-aminobutyrate aminotransferase/(S)-3-amino-2-methylpropionate transaminase
MVAVEFVHDGQASRPNTELPKTLAAEAVGRGLILLTCGIRSNVIRFLPALTAPLEVVDEGMAIFAELLAEHG